jgi:hypothetical protein
MRASYRERGCSPEWIEQRMGEVARNSALLTEWQSRGVEDIDQLTLLLEEIYKDVFELEGLPETASKSTSPSLNSSPLETALAGLGEAVALFLHREKASRGFGEILEDVQLAGSIVEQACHQVRAVLQFTGVGGRSFQLDGEPARQLSMFDKPFRG